MIQYSESQLGYSAVGASADVDEVEPFRLEFRLGGMTDTSTAGFGFVMEPGPSGVAISPTIASTAVATVKKYEVISSQGFIFQWKRARTSSLTSDQLNAYRRKDWIADYPWLKYAKAIETLGHDDIALRIIYKEINGWLGEGRFDKVNQLLQAVRVEDLSVDMLLAFLTVTLRFHAQLSSRARFFTKARSQIRDDAVNEIGLLAGLG